jgi:uncharacterized repeat protein (TIGR01451 family)
MEQRRRLIFALAALTGAVLLAGGDWALAQGDSWEPIADMPTPRRLLAAATDGKNLYTFGGCGSPCFGPPFHTSADEETTVEVYLPHTKRWKVKGRMPTILFGAAAAAPGNGKIYTFGGYVSGNVVQEYDPKNDSWKIKRPMPTPRYGLAAVALGGKIYVLGGSGPSAAVEIYDPAKDTWAPGAPMPTPRVFLAAAALDGRIYAIGGSPDCCGNSQTNTVEIYDPGTNTWTQGDSLPIAQQVSAAVEANGKIYVFGGFIAGSGVQSNTFEYDPKRENNRWISRTPMPVERDQAPAVLIGGVAYVPGGSVNCHCQALSRTDGYTPPVSPDPEVEITISKSDGRDRVSPAEKVTYSIVVSNESGVAAQATITDNLVATGLTGFRWCLGDACKPSFSTNIDQVVSLPAKSSTTFTVTGTVPCGLIKLTNTACVTVAGQPAKCASDTDTVLPAPPKLRIEKMGPVSVRAGEMAPYMIEVFNEGVCTVCGAELNDPTPPGLEFVASEGLCGGGFPCSLGCIPPRESTTVFANFEVPCEQSCPGVIKNSASVTIADESHQAEVETRVECPEIDLSISKDDGQDMAAVLSDLTYKLKIQNHSQCPAIDALITDKLPPELLEPQCIGENRADCTFSGERDLSIQVDVPGHSEVMYEVQGKLGPECIAALYNEATAFDPEGSVDPEPVNNTDFDLTAVFPGPGVSLICSGPSLGGDAVTFTFVLLNGGPAAQADNPGDEFTDTLPAGLTLVSAAASSGTVTTAANTVSWNGSIAACGGMVTITVEATIDAGTEGMTLCNPGTVFFDADGDGTNESSATSDSCCVRVLPAPMIPTAGTLGLATLTLLLAALSLGRLRRPSGGRPPAPRPGRGSRK